MANEFTHNKKLKLIAGEIADDMAYIKGAASFFSQAEIKGKKFGQTVSGYLPDPGTVVEGTVANPDAITEVEIEAKVGNFNSSVETDLWNDLVDIEDFNDEIASPRAQNIALTTHKSVMKKNMIRSAQTCVVTLANVGFGLLTDAAKKLNELGVAGKKLSFHSPTITGKIAEAGLSKFIPNEKMAKIYEDAYLGQYAGAAQIEVANTPVLKMTSTMDNAPTISGTVVSDANGNVLGVTAIKAVTKSGSSKTLEVGAVYTLAGLKIRNAAGVETNQAYEIIIEGLNADGTAIIPDLRIAAEGTGYGNANAVMTAAAITAATSGSTATFTLSNKLTAGKTYVLGQVRTEKCLGWDQYRFENLPATDTSDVATVGGITITMMQGSEVKNGVKLSRLDMPFLCKLYDHRSAVTTYVQLD